MGQDDARDDVPGWTDSLPFAVWQADQALHRVVVEAISSLGVTITQLGLAVHISELGALSASELARRFRITPQSVTTALGHLVERGWLRRRAHPVHGRVILYELTPAGAEAVARGRERLAGVTGRLRAAIGEAQVDTMVTGSKALLATLVSVDW